MKRKSSKLSLAVFRRAGSGELNCPEANRLHFDMQAFILTMLQQIIEARIISLQTAKQTQDQLEFFSNYDESHVQQKMNQKIAQDKEPKGQSVKFLHRESQLNQQRTSLNYDSNIFLLTTTGFSKSSYMIKKKAQTVQITLRDQYRSILASPSSIQKANLVKLQLNSPYIPTQKRINQQVEDRQIEFIRNFKCTMQNRLQEGYNATKAKLQLNQSKLKIRKVKQINPFSFDNDGNKIQVRLNPSMNFKNKKVLTVDVSVGKKEAVTTQVSAKKYRIYNRKSIQNADLSKISIYTKSPNPQSFGQLIKNLKLKLGVTLKEKMQKTQRVQAGGFFPAINIRA